MNTLFIIGNGFDLNLNLKTGYKDFYTYYQSITSEKETISNLKDSIRTDLENWSDLELALGDYTKIISSLEEFDEIYEDLVEQLANYLSDQENNFDFTTINRDKFYEDLISPENYLPPADKIKVLDFKKNWESSTWKINIMTFNYTNTIEKILNDTALNKKIGIHHSRYEVYLRNVEHIHGYLDNRMILGVNDNSQISNIKFHDNEDVCNALIKSNNNRVSKQTIDEKCEDLIKKAQLICIFGSSIGNTDKLWWELIGTKLKESCHLIIFTKGRELNDRFQHKVARSENEFKNFFLNKTSLTDQEKVEVRDKIYVAINRSIFSNLKLKS